MATLPATDTEVRTLSTVAPSIRRRWLPITAGAAALALIGALSIIALRQDAAAPAPQPAAPAEAARELPQADWAVHSYPAGIKSKRGPAINRRVNNATRAIVAKLDDLYSAAFLDPESFAEATKKHFAGPAAKRFRNAGITIAGAQDIQFKRRRTGIGVEGNNARRAAAKTDLVVVGKLDGERFRVRHRAMLWLERSKGSWKVIAFDVTQRPRR